MHCDCLQEWLSLQLSAGAGTQLQPHPLCQRLELSSSRNRLRYAGALLAGYLADTTLDWVPGTWCKAAKSSGAVGAGLLPLFDEGDSYCHMQGPLLRLPKHF